ncbi:MAG: hypothetical protein WBA57_26365 [Elainellaceae cyanobacterium]
MHSYDEKILGNVAYLVEVESEEAAQILRQCDLQLDEGEEGGWHIKIVAPRDAYVILRDQDNVAAQAVYRAFTQIAAAEQHTIISISHVPKIIDLDESWRHSKPQCSTLDEKILASAVNFLLEGDEDERSFANLLRDCYLTTEEVYDYDYGEEHLTSLKIEIRSPRYVFELLNESDQPFAKSVTKAIEAALPRKYFYLPKKFINLAKNIQALPNWREELFSSQENSSSLDDEERCMQKQLEILLWSWKSILVSQQRDFIKRLVEGHDTDLLESNISEVCTELTKISHDTTTQLRKFCWDMADKFKNNSPVKTVFINFLKGKLGEEAFSKILGNKSTAVDYELKKKGDGKIDFKWSEDPNICIQVKARNGQPEKVEWVVDRDELELNDVIVCFLITEAVSEAQSEYNIVSAGFIPTFLVSQLENQDGKFRISLDSLLYIGGLVPFLGSLQALNQRLNRLKSFDFILGNSPFGSSEKCFYESLLKKTKLSKLNQKNLASKLSREELEIIWENIILAIKQPATKALLKQQAYLEDITCDKILIHVKSEPHMQRVQSKEKDIQCAVIEVMGKSFKLDFEDSKLQNNSRSRKISKSTDASSSSVDSLSSWLALPSSTDERLKDDDDVPF